MKQQNLFSGDQTLLFHGGELALQKRKALRPLDSKRALGLTLKAGRHDLLAREGWIENEARKWAGRFHLKAYEVAVNHDHIHLVLRLPSRRCYHAFIRAFTAALTRVFGKGLWLLLPFSRIVAWGRDFRTACAYARKNRAEAHGERPYEKRRDGYKRWRQRGGKGGSKDSGQGYGKRGNPS